MYILYKILYSKKSAKTFGVCNFVIKFIKMGGVKQNVKFSSLGTKF